MGPDVLVNICSHKDKTVLPPSNIYNDKIFTGTDDLDYQKGADGSLERRLNAKVS